MIERMKFFERLLMTRPMCTVDPLSYDFFIHYTSPALTGAPGELYDHQVFLN
jgi:hypothetical protein